MAMIALPLVPAGKLNALAQAEVRARPELDAAILVHPVNQQKAGRLDRREHRVVIERFGVTRGEPDKELDQYFLRFIAYHIDKGRHAE